VPTVSAVARSARTVATSNPATTSSSPTDADRTRYLVTDERGMAPPSLHACCRRTLMSELQRWSASVEVAGYPTCVVRILSFGTSRQMASLRIVPRFEACRNLASPRHTDGFDAAVQPAIYGRLPPPNRKEAAQTGCSDPGWEMPQDLIPLGCTPIGLASEYRAGPRRSRDSSCLSNRHTLLMSGKRPSSARSRSWSVESTEPDIWRISRERRSPGASPRILGGIDVESSARDGF
jgi:hypothetical protein